MEEREPRTVTDNVRSMVTEFLEQSEVTSARSEIVGLHREVTALQPVVVPSTDVNSPWGATRLDPVVRVYTCTVPCCACWYDLV